MIDPKSRYLDLLKQTLTDSLGVTTIGRERLDRLQRCIEDVIARGVPGDVLDAGVWRGGAAIFMRALLDLEPASTRRVWVAGSFRGLPPPDPARYPADEGDAHDQQTPPSSSLDEVRANFSKFGMLDDRVRFLEGRFEDTLGTPEIERLAVLRLDGDTSGSTLTALENLYHRVPVGGYVIIDDYGAIPACRQAVEDFRARHGIRDEVHWIDATGVYWQRGAPAAADPQETIDAFHDLYYNGRPGEGPIFQRTSWLGVPCLKCPLDVWIYQEILFEVRPDLIIETGTNLGGSALYLAHILDILGHGAVVSIDVAALPRPAHPRITYVQGSSSDAALVTAAIGDRPRGTCVVILDSDHSEAHVTAELELLAPYVTPGSYLIVEDTNINGHPTYPSFGPGPFEAVQKFLPAHPEFVVDRSREKFLMTFNPGGYLRKLG